MKKITLLALALSFSLATSAASLCGGSGRLPSDHGLPWPWGQEIRFALKDIAGTWKVVGNDCADYFFFKVKADPDGDKVVQIIQYDANKCKLTSQGIGYLDDRYLYAQMVRSGGDAYNLTIHAFNSNDVDRSSDRRGLRAREEAHGDVTMALSLFPLSSSAQRTAFEISRIDSSGSPVCK